MGQNTELKPIPKHLIPSPGSQAIVGRYHAQRLAYQDGGQFYDLEDGALIEDLKQFVANDYDTAGATAARKRFLEIQPWYRMATAEERGAHDAAGYFNGEEAAQ